MGHNMANKKTIHIPKGLHEYYKVECRKRGLVMQYQLEQLIINQLDKWGKENFDEQVSEWKKMFDDEV